MKKWLQLLGLAETEEDSVRVTVAGCTDTGRRRERNEDTFLVADLQGSAENNSEELQAFQLAPGGYLLAVADGLGGHAGGDVASRIAVKVLHEELMRNHLEPDDEQRLKEAVQIANRRLREYAAHHVHLQGLSTTLTAVYVHQDTAYLAHVGDTRAYLLRQGGLRRLTQDQTLAQYLADLGQPARARSVARNVLLRALGAETEVTPALTHLALQRGDCLLLCSDGLFNKVSESEMAQILDEVQNVGTATRWLVTQANQRGGEDNITAVAARFHGPGLPTAEELPAAEAITLELPLAA